MRGCSRIWVFMVPSYSVFPAHAGVFFIFYEHTKNIQTNCVPFSQGPLKLHIKNNTSFPELFWIKRCCFLMRYCILQNNHSTRKNLLRFLTVIFTKDKTGRLSSSCQLPQLAIIYLIFWNRKKPIIILGRT